MPQNQAQIANIQDLYPVYTGSFQSPFQTVTENLEAGQTKGISIPFTTLACISNSAPDYILFNFGQNGVNTLMDDGMSFRMPFALPQVSITNTDVTPHSVTLALGFGDIRDNRSSISGIVQIGNTSGEPLFVQNTRDSTLFVDNKTMTKTGIGMTDTISGTIPLSMSYVLKSMLGTASAPVKLLSVRLCNQYDNPVYVTYHSAIPPENKNYFVINKGDVFDLDIADYDVYVHETLGYQTTIDSTNKIYFVTDKQTTPSESTSVVLAALYKQKTIVL